MHKAWDTVAAYVAANAHNPGKGYRLKDLTDKQVLRYAAAEMVELLLAPNQMDEMADLLGCLFHYAQRKGWTLAQLEQELIRKLRVRFPKTEILAPDDSGIYEPAWAQNGHGWAEPPYDENKPDELDRMI